MAGDFDQAQVSSAESLLIETTSAEVLMSDLLLWPGSTHVWLGFTLYWPLSTQSGFRWKTTDGHVRNSVLHVEHSYHQTKSIITSGGCFMFWPESCNEAEGYQIEYNNETRRGE